MPGGKFREVNELRLPLAAALLGLAVFLFWLPAFSLFSTLTSGAGEGVEGAIEVFIEREEG